MWDLTDIDFINQLLPSPLIILMKLTNIFALAFTVGIQKVFSSFVSSNSEETDIGYICQKFNQNISIGAASHDMVRNPIDFENSMIESIELEDLNLFYHFLNIISYSSAEYKQSFNIFRVINEVLSSHFPSSRLLELLNSFGKEHIRQMIQASHSSMLFDVYNSEQSFILNSFGLAVNHKESSGPKDDFRHIHGGLPNPNGQKLYPSIEDVFNYGL